MSPNEEPKLVDDLDGSPADVTVTFTFEGVHYELNLSKKNRSVFIHDFARFMTAARKTGGAGPKMHYQRTKADPEAVRHWARAHGIDVPEGKRLPRSVIDQFHAAGN